MQTDIIIPSFIPYLSLSLSLLPFSHSTQREIALFLTWWAHSAYGAGAKFDGATVHVEIAQTEDTRRQDTTSTTDAQTILLCSLVYFLFFKSFYNAFTAYDGNKWHSGALHFNIQEALGAEQCIHCHHACIHGGNRRIII